jgi:hypothetical protein
MMCWNIFKFIDFSFLLLLQLIGAYLDPRRSASKAASGEGEGMIGDNDAKGVGAVCLWSSSLIADLCGTIGNLRGHIGFHPNRRNLLLGQTTFGHPGHCHLYAGRTLPRVP